MLFSKCCCRGPGYAAPKYTTCKRIILSLAPKSRLKLHHWTLISPDAAPRGIHIRHSGKQLYLALVCLLCLRSHSLPPRKAEDLFPSSLQMCYPLCYPSPSANHPPSEPCACALYLLINSVFLLIISLLSI